MELKLNEVELVYSSFQVVLYKDKEVNCQKDGPDSLKYVAEYFSTTSDSSKQQIVRNFCNKLVQALCSALKAGERCKLKSFQEKSLIEFQKLKLTSLPLIWHSFASELGLPPVNPFQQQSVNRELFQKLLVDAAKSCSGSVVARPRTVRTHLSVEEENAVRYASGYVTMKLLNKFKSKSGTALFVDSLCNMAVNTNKDDSSFYDYTLEWMMGINRGGLFCVNEPTFCLFKAIELKTQELLPLVLSAKDPNNGDMVKKIMDDDDVESWWSMLSTDIPDESSRTELLKEIVDMWVGLRGFAAG